MCEQFSKEALAAGTAALRTRGSRSRLAKRRASGHLGCFLLRDRTRKVRQTVSAAGAKPPIVSSTPRVLALLLSVTFSSFAALFAKYALESFSPFTMTALRVWIASLVLLPVAVRIVPGGLRWSSFVRALPMSLCYTGNITLFALGIGFTTALTSQLLYLLVPVLVLIGARIFFRE